jgi:negative regulator of replication initiation
VSDGIKGSLEQINDVSRQLLSRILTMYNKSQESSSSINESNNNIAITDDAAPENELIELIANRDSLLHSLFEKNTREEISIELNLLNEMIELDSKLSNQSKAYKQMLAERVIKLKKSKKVSKSYQKY